MQGKINKYFLGEEGESVVEDILKGIGGISTVADMYLKTRDKTTQIDFVVVAQSGIHVLEVKNVTGTVISEPDKVTWAVMYPGRTYGLYNPVLQNSGHIRELRKILGSTYRYINHVVFSDKVDLKGSNKNIGLFSDLWEHFEEHANKTYMSKEEVEEVYLRLRDLASENRHLALEHNLQQARHSKK